MGCSVRAGRVAISAKVFQSVVINEAPPSRGEVFSNSSATRTRSYFVFWSFCHEAVVDSIFNKNYFTRLRKE